MNALAASIPGGVTLDRERCVRGGRSWDFLEGGDLRARRVSIGGCGQWVKGCSLI